MENPDRIPFQPLAAEGRKARVIARKDEEQEEILCDGPDSLSLPAQHPEYPPAPHSPDGLSHCLVLLPTAFLERLRFQQQARQRVTGQGPLLGRREVLFGDATVEAREASPSTMRRSMVKLEPLVKLRHQDESPHISSWYSR